MTQAGPVNAAALSCRGLTKRFGERLVLDNITFDVPPGGSVAVLGRSGAGKSTLLRCLNLLASFDEGEIALGGTVFVSRKSGTLFLPNEPHVVRTKIGMVFQEWSLWPNLTVAQNIGAGPRLVLGKTKDEALRVVEELAQKLGLTRHLGAYPHTLSGGEKQRVAIARALAMDPEILLLDEITSALDPATAGEVLSVIRALRKEGLTCVIVTHHIEFAEAVADEVLFLVDGRVHEQGRALVPDQAGRREEGRAALSRYLALAPSAPDAAIVRHSLQP